MALSNIVDIPSEVVPVLGSSTSDAALVSLVTRWVESAARKFVGHNITQQTYTAEYHRRYDLGSVERGEELYYENGQVGIAVDSPADGHRLQLDNGFARSVTSVYVDINARFGMGGSDFGASTLLESTAYELELDNSSFSKSGVLIRHNYAWPSKPGTIKVAYVAGLSAAELDDEFLFVKQAIVDEIMDNFNDVKSRRHGGGGPLKKVTYAGDVSREFAVSGHRRGGLSPAARERLAPIKMIKL